MKRELLIVEFLTAPWAMMPERLNAVAAVLTRWSRGDATSAVAQLDPDQASVSVDAAWQ